MATSTPARAMGAGPLATSFASAAARWDAVRKRDASADGAFVFAVRTTGIFCRPSCSARPAKRENVAFYGDCQQARQAGFRPCKRCQPETPSRGRALVERACALLTDPESDEPRPLSVVARQLQLTPSALTRLFSRELGLTPREFLAQRKRSRFRTALKNGQPIAEATSDAGYGSSSRVYESDGAGLGMTPATYRRGGEGAEIAWAIAPSPFGKVLVAATERGICAVFLGDSESKLLGELRADFPAAKLVPGDASMKSRVEAVLARLDGRKPTSLLARDLAFDIRATAFQWQVWKALTEIPAGQTMTYGQIAAAIGHPGAARAVGRACATNPVSIVVPCHRAIGSSGSLTGYRWGVERKKKLLEREKTRAAR
jgi:AraC family transcriptional regulator of adaptative response/methylated-DNA-[protein]-cysteine methyltransferase